MASNAPRATTGRAAQAAGVDAAAARSGAAAPGQSTVLVFYLERSPILVRGSVTGRQYVFSQSRPSRYVDARDAPSLLRTRFFRRG